jgi:hypothetical protein
MPTAAGRPWGWIRVQQLLTWAVWWIAGYPGLHELAPVMHGALGLVLDPKMDRGRARDALEAGAGAAGLRSLEETTRAAETRGDQLPGAKAGAEARASAWKAVELLLYSAAEISAAQAGSADALWARARHSFGLAGIWSELRRAKFVGGHEGPMLSLVPSAAVASRHRVEQLWIKALALGDEICTAGDADAMEAVLDRYLDTLTPDRVELLIYQAAALYEPQLPEVPASPTAMLPPIDASRLERVGMALYIEAKAGEVEVEAKTPADHASVARMRAMVRLLRAKGPLDRESFDVQAGMPLAYEMMRRELVGPKAHDPQIVQGRGVPLAEHLDAQAALAGAS